MLDLEHSHGFLMRPDGYFMAFGGDVLLKAEKRGDTLVYPFDARYSTPDKDREEEIAIQKGLNFEPFKEHGFFNWNHNDALMMGLPVGKKAWYDDAGWRGAGEIIKGMPLSPGYDSDMVVRQHNQLKKAGTKRGLCCSVEGKVLKRSDNGKRIEKADVYNVALTFRPINPNCTINMLAKAFLGLTPIIEGEEFFRSLSVGSIKPMTKEDLEGAESRKVYDPKPLISHLMRKGHSRAAAERHVYKYLYTRQAHQRSA